MKVVAISGSPNRNGNTAEAIQIVAKELNAEGIDVEVLQVGHKSIRGCIACGGCAKAQNEKCVFPDDFVNDYLHKMKEADGIILASPVYYSAISGNMKCFLERAFYVAGVNGGMLRHKVGASMVVVRRSGGLPAFEQLNNFLLYSEMVIPSSVYWNVIHGRVAGDVQHDPEGVQILQVLGQNMAWLLKSLDHSKESVVAKPRPEKITTNFVR